MAATDLRKNILDTPEAARKTPEFARLLNDLAVACHNSSFAEVDSYYKQSREIWENALGPNDPNVAVSLLNLSALYRRANFFDEAERLLQCAQRIWQKGQRVLTEDMAPLQAERLFSNTTLEHFGAYTLDLRSRVEAGLPEAKNELQLVIERLGPWYHNLTFAGTSTLSATPDYPASRWRMLEPLIPKDLRGKTVLDIGCNSGFFSVEMKKRGAARVVGIDIMPFVLAQARFTAHWFNVPIELYEMSVYDVDSLDMKFDVVLFIGVLYHLKHPLYALEKISSVCKETMYLVSVVRGSKGEFVPADDYPGDELEIFNHPHYPRLYFVEKSFNADESNWWFATKSCLKAMTRVAGFPRIEEIDHPEYLVCRK